MFESMGNWLKFCALPFASCSVQKRFAIATCSGCRCSGDFLCAKLKFFETILRVMVEIFIWVQLTWAIRCMLKHWRENSSSCVDEPIVDLEECQVGLRCNCTLLIFGRVGMLTIRRKKHMENWQWLKISMKIESIEIPLTTKCWKSHARMTLVACFGKIPRFCRFECIE